MVNSAALDIKVATESQKRQFKIEKIFTIPNSIYESICAETGTYDIRGEDGRIIGSCNVESVFDDTFRLTGSVDFYTPERLLLESGDLELAAQYVGTASSMVSPVDPTRRVMTYLLKVDLAHFRTVPPRKK